MQAIQKKYNHYNPKNMHHYTQIHTHTYIYIYIYILIKHILIFYNKKLFCKIINIKNKKIDKKINKFMIYGIYI